MLCPTKLVSLGPVPDIRLVHSLARD